MKNFFKLTSESIVSQREKFENMNTCSEKNGQCLSVEKQLRTIIASRVQIECEANHDLNALSAIHTEIKSREIKITKQNRKHVFKL